MAKKFTAEQVDIELINQKLDTLIKSMEGHNEEAKGRDKKISFLEQFKNRQVVINAVGGFVLGGITLAIISKFI